MKTIVTTFTVFMISVPYAFSQTDARDMCRYKFGLNTPNYFSCLKEEGVYTGSHANVLAPSAPSSEPTAANEPQVLDCIKAPAGIADACDRAFQNEYNPNPGQIPLLRSACIRGAISVKVVNRCLKTFPLNSTKDEKATYDRANCIDEASVDEKNVYYRCPM